MKKSVRKAAIKFLDGGGVLYGRNLAEAATHLSGELQGQGPCPIVEVISILRRDLRHGNLVEMFDGGRVIGYRRPNAAERYRAAVMKDRMRRQARSRWRRTHRHNPQTRGVVLMLMGLDRVRQDLAD